MWGNWRLSLVRRVMCAGRSLWGSGVGRDAVWGFGYGDAVDLGVWGEGVVEFACQLISDVLGDVLCGGIELIEGGALVEVLVVEGFADLDEGLLDDVEVAEESFGVELGAGDCGGGFEVVAVGWLRGAIEDDGVGGAELVGDLYLERWNGEHVRTR